MTVQNSQNSFHNLPLKVILRQSSQLRYYLLVWTGALS